MPDPFELDWYAILTSYRAELATAEALREKGLDAYCPASTEWSRHARRKTKVQRPLFERYLFVGVEELTGEAHQAIKKVDGVEHFLGIGRPRKINYRELDKVRQSEILGELDNTKDTTPEIGQGDAVLITAGHFEGFAAKVLKVVNEKKVKLVIEEYRRKFGRGEFELPLASLKLEAA